MKNDFMKLGEDDEEQAAPSFDIGGSGSTTMKASGGFAPVNSGTDFDKMKSGVPSDTPDPVMPISYGGKPSGTLPPAGPAVLPQEPAPAIPQPNAAPAPMPRTSPQIPGMPSSITPDQLSSYINMQKQGMSQYGPEQRMALQQQLNNRQNSFGYKATEGLKGLADAIMQGVAGAGNPGNKQQFLASEQQKGQDQISAFNDARKSNMENVQGKMGLDQMDPKSPLSQQKQNDYAALFKDLGYPPEKLKGMSAANIENALSLMSTYGGKKLEAQIKSFELAIEQKRTEAALANVQSEAKNREQGRKFEEKKLRTEHPIASLLAGTTSQGETPEGRVSVVSPTGQVGHIPAGQLKDALAKGYKQQ